MNITNEEKAEYAKCAADPAYFINTYVKIKNQFIGLTPFNLYDFQKDTLEKLLTNKKTIVLKSRQMGLSSLVSAYAVWKIVFQDNTTAVFVAYSPQAASEIVSKILFAIKFLPDWMRPSFAEDSRVSFKLKNGSRVIGTSSCSTLILDTDIDLFVVDECAYIENLNDVLESLSPLLSADSSETILVSSASGRKNVFYKLWLDAEKFLNGYNPIKLLWNVHILGSKEAPIPLGVGEELRPIENNLMFCETSQYVLLLW